MSQSRGEATPQVGLVLSGGGVRGVAHVGVIKALREADVEVDVIAGTSAGALVGVMAAADCAIEDMLTFWMDTEAFGFQRFAASITGVFDTTSFVGDIKKFVPYERFEDLPRKLSVAVTCMIKGEVEYISKGPLWPLVLASATFPLVFTPIEIDGELYMDGGILDNLPVRAIRDQCDFIVGVNVSPQRTVEASDISNPREIVERIMDLRFAASRQDESMIDYLLVPSLLETYSTFATDSMIEIFELGYDAAKGALPEIKQRLAQSGKRLRH